MQNKTYQVFDKNNNLINTVNADIDFLSNCYKDCTFIEVVTKEVISIPKRHITVGAFYDRFGTEKWNILSSQLPIVQALIKDSSVRKHIDLDDPQLFLGLQMIVQAGFPISPEDIISSDIQPKELP